MGMEGCLVLGKGDNPYAVAHVWNCGGNVSDLENEPRGGVNDALEQLERGCYSIYSVADLEIDPAELLSDAQRATYSFAALHPKITAFVSMAARGRKRFIQVGAGRGGPFAKACTGDAMKGKETVVWQARPNPKNYNYSVAEVLRAMEAALP